MQQCKQLQHTAANYVYYSILLESWIVDTIPFTRDWAPAQNDQFSFHLYAHWKGNPGY